MIRAARRTKACDRCRAMKIKCDEVRPECLRCRRAGTACAGLILGSIFVNAGPPIDRLSPGRTTRQRRIYVDEPHGREEDFREDRLGLVSPLSLHKRNACLLPRPCLSQEDEAEGIEESSGQDTYGSLSRYRCLSEERVDPFSTLARKTTRRENYLVDFYVRNIISFFGGEANISLNPQRDICFRVIIEGAATMDVMFAYVSGFLTKELGYSDAESRKYQLLAIRSINRTISDPSQRFLNSTIMAILGFINLRYQLHENGPLSEERRELQAHIQGVRCLIKGRGGFIALCNDPAMSWIMITTDLMAFGELSAGWTPLSLPGLLTPRPEISASAGESNLCPYVYHLEALLQEYTGAFHNFFKEAQSRKQRCLSMAPEDSGYFLISRLFRPGIHMNRFLINPICMGVSRICVLFFLNVILWDNRKDLYSLFNGYFKRVRVSIVEQGLDLGGSMDMFFWILITNPETHRIDYAERLWLVARLLRVHNQLSAHLQAEVEHSLLGFIISEDEYGSPPFDPDIFHSVVKYDLEHPVEQNSFEKRLVPCL